MLEKETTVEEFAQLYEELKEFELIDQRFADLNERISTVRAFIDSLPQAAFAEAATRQITIQPGTPREKQFVGEHYLLHYGLPQFFFHVNATYAMARHNGVELGKRDYMGKF